MAKVEAIESLPPGAIPTARPWDDDAGKALRVPTGDWLTQGPPPQAVRIVRPGRTSVVVPLIAGRWYLVGRAEKSDLYFEDETVSRQHAFLFFEPEVSKWVLRDNGSANGTFLPGTDTSSPRRVPHWVPVGLAAGLTVQLGDGDSRLEFLETLPPTSDDLLSDSEWKSAPGIELDQATRRASRLHRPVFLLGSTGRGKMFVAHRIHELSAAEGRFVYINCGTLPTDRTMLHSELLGHTKGAYTGARDARVGKLFEADGGTLFLDEVESLAPEAQVFLLDLLEEGNDNLTPLGAQAAHGLRRPTFRLISASKQPLEESPLRRDLAQRLALGELIPLPSLQERREDIPVLVHQFLASLALKPRHPVKAQVSEQALAFLMDQPWPGEVRELQGTVQTVAERVADNLGEASEGAPLLLGLEDFRKYLVTRAVAFGRRPQAPIPMETVVAHTRAPAQRKRPSDLTRQDVEVALQAASNNKTHAARALGIALNTLKRKMVELGRSGD